MIKLVNILNEITPPAPENVYNYGHGPNDDEFIKRGYRLGKTSIDSETGKVGTDVEYLPEIEKIRIDLMHYRKQFQPFKFSSNQDISKLAKDINTSLTKLGNMMYALDKMIDLHKNA